MQEVSVREARERIGHLLDAVELGEEIVILRRGKPVARLIAVEQEKKIAFPDRSALRRQLPPTQVGSARLIRELRNEQRY